MCFSQSWHKGTSEYFAAKKKQCATEKKNGKRVGHGKADFPPDLFEILCKVAAEGHAPVSESALSQESSSSSSSSQGSRESNSTRSAVMPAWGWIFMLMTWYVF